MKIQNQQIIYADLFWLFMAGSLLGVLIEGVFCVFRYGHWETHTVAVWGPFCIIYGIGAVVLYIGAVLLEGKSYILQFVIFTFAATVIEYLCGAYQYHFGRRPNYCFGRRAHCGKGYA